MITIKTSYNREEESEMNDDGFTLIELAIVIMVIAILMAVALPTFLGVKNHAQHSDAEQTLANAAQAEIDFSLSTGSTAPGGSTYTGTDSQLVQEEPNINWGSYPAGNAPVGYVSPIPDQATAQAINLQIKAADGVYYTDLLDNGVVFHYASKDGTYPADLPLGATQADAATPGTPGQWWSGWGTAVASA